MIRTPMNTWPANCIHGANKFRPLRVAGIRHALDSTYRQYSKLCKFGSPFPASGIRRKFPIVYTVKHGRKTLLPTAARHKMQAPTKLLTQEMPLDALYWSRLRSYVPSFSGRLIDKSQLFERSQELDDIGLSNLPAATKLLT